MKYTYINNDKDRNVTWFTLMTIAAFLVFGATSCNKLLEVTDPDIVTPETLSIETLKNGSLGDLAVAISGSSAGHGATAGLIVMSGLMTDEYDYVGTFPTRREADTRILANTNGTMNRIYGNLHRARAAAEATVDLAKTSGESEIESEMESIAGYIYVIFAESFCGSVPFSKVTPEGDITLGTPQSADEMYNAAISLFDEAIASASAASNDDLGYLARVGKARALLGLGNISGAASEVSSVPDDFVYYIEHSDNSRRQENGIFTMTTTRRQYSIADNKGINGIDYRTRGYGTDGTDGDPRVPWNGGTEFGQNDKDLYYNQLKYTSVNAPVKLASGIEARLIEAEAAAQAGDNATVASIHDDLRATEGLGAIDLTGMTIDQLVDYHFTERALWLYSSGHRHGDMRRLVNSYSRNVADVFPWGTAPIHNVDYSTTIAFLIPQSEANNPNFEECDGKTP